MTRFNYQAVDGAGFAQSGTLNATSHAEAVSQLYAQNLTPTEVLEAASQGASASTSNGELKQAELVAIVRELATLLSSGVGLTESFETLHSATTNHALQQALSRLIYAVQSGETFSVALRKAEIKLPEYVYALARAGEATGNIGAALQRAADQLEFDEQMQSETREALIYPVILITTGVAAVSFIFSFVVPRFANLLNGRKVELPWLSSAVLKTGLFVNAYWPIFLLGFVGFAMAGFWVSRNPAARARLEAFFSRLPVFSGWMAGAETARWTSILAVLVQSRVPILLSLDLAATSVRLADNAQRLRSMQDEVRLGKTLSQATEDRRMLEGTPLSMLKVGEKTGDLATMLGHVASHAAQRHRALQRRMLSLIEPVSILVIGVVIGIIMVGVVLAMTSLTEVKL